MQLCILFYSYLASLYMHNRAMVVLLNTSDHCTHRTDDDDDRRNATL